MADLSPAAQAVLNATKVRFYESPPTAAELAAWILRALADHQPAPITMGKPIDHWHPDERTRRELHNIAAELLQQQEAEIKGLRAQQAPVPVEGELPAAWLYLGEPDFDGTKWRENWRVTTDEQLALFKAQPDKPVPLFRRPAHALPPSS